VVRYENALIYSEPADWHFPIRHVLAAVLLKAGRSEEAEVVYWEDLRRNPEKGWSLFGLSKAFEAQDKIEEAYLIGERYRNGWTNADVVLTGPRM
jgi:hypothetical protein